MSLSGVIKRFKADRGFGFIVRDDGQEDLFFHCKDVKNAVSEEWLNDEKVTFDVGLDERSGKPQGVNVTLVGPNYASRNGIPATPSPNALTGTIGRFRADKGFGFIVRDDGQEDIFFHCKQVTNCVWEDMLNEQKVSFEEGVDERSGKPQAVNIVVLSAVAATGGGTITLPGQNPIASRPGALSGTIRRFRPDKGFGFIVRDDGQEDVFFHCRDVLNCVSEYALNEEKVTFELGTDERSGKIQAVSVMLKGGGAAVPGVTGGIKGGKGIAAAIVPPGSFDGFGGGWWDFIVKGKGKGKGVGGLAAGRYSPY